MFSESNSEPYFIVAREFFWFSFAGAKENNN